MNHMTAKQATPTAQLCTGIQVTILCLRVFGLTYLCAMRNHNHFYVDMRLVVSFVNYFCVEFVDSQFPIHLPLGFDYA